VRAPGAASRQASQRHLPPRPHPAQQFTCWSPASAQGPPAAGTLRQPQPPSTGRGRGRGDWIWFAETSASPGRAQETPRSLPLPRCGGRLRLAAGVVAPTARERELPSWRRRRGRTEHAQLGAGPRRSWRRARRALRSAAPGFRGRRARSPRGPGGVDPGAEPAPSRPLQASAAPPQPPLARSLYPWPAPETSPGWRGGGVILQGRPAANPLAGGAGTPMLGHLP
jgi:hypothetical protein